MALNEVYGPINPYQQSPMGITTGTSFVNPYETSPLSFSGGELPTDIVEFSQAGEKKQGMSTGAKVGIGALVLGSLVYLGVGLKTGNWKLGLDKLFKGASNTENKTASQIGEEMFASNRVVGKTTDDVLGSMKKQEEKLTGELEKLVKEGIKTDAQKGTAVKLDRQIRTLREKQAMLGNTYNAGSAYNGEINLFGEGIIKEGESLSKDIAKLLAARPAATTTTTPITTTAFGDLKAFDPEAFTRSLERDWLAMTRGVKEGDKITEAQIRLHEILKDQGSFGGTSLIPANAQKWEQTALDTLQSNIPAKLADKYRPETIENLLREATTKEEKAAIIAQANALHAPKEDGGVIKRASGAKTHYYALGENGKLAHTETGIDIKPAQQKGGGTPSGRFYGDDYADFY